MQRGEKKEENRTEREKLSVYIYIFTLTCMKRMNQHTKKILYFIKEILEPRKLKAAKRIFIFIVIGAMLRERTQN